MIETIEPARYRQQIEALLTSVGLSPCHVLIVSSVQEWSRAAGVPERNPDRAAKALRRGDGRATIVLAESITAEMYDGVVGALEFRGFSDEVSRINTAESFLEHLVLHEAAICC